MKIYLRKNLICLLIFFSAVMKIQAFELDTSIDDEIRRNYNPSALEQQLPALPKTAPDNASSNIAPPKSLPVTDPAKPQLGVKKLPNTYQKADKSTSIRIKKGTKFKVKSNAYLSDSTPQGARFSFVTLQPVTQRYITLPAGTVFKAVVVDSHPPQATGNGGLLEITVDGIVHNGQTYYAKAKITKANHKKIFVNNIKGKRQYWHGVSSQVDKGQNFYKKTRRTSSKLADNPIGIIISPIPTVLGMGVYAVNLAGSPLFAMFSKGGKIAIPAGSEFEIKLLEDTYLD